MGRWGRGVTLAALVVVGACVSVAGAARTADLRDDFATLDGRRWTTSSRPFGHGFIEPANVFVADGLLNVRLPAETRNGGELRSTALYRYGSYSARLKAANAPSSLTAFFLYKRPDYAQELDIEIFNDSSRQIMFTTYSGGRETNSIVQELPFDATAGFHVYTIEYDPGLVRFLVDGSELRRWSSGVPRSSMYLHVNAWFPSWLGGEAPAGDRFTQVDWIEHTAR